MPTFPTLPLARKSGTAAVSGKVSANTSAIASSAAAALAPWKASPPSCMSYLSKYRPLAEQIEFIVNAGSGAWNQRALEEPPTNIMMGVTGS